MNAAQESEWPLEAEAKSVADADCDNGNGGPRRALGAVLVIDDEQIVCMLTRQVLESLGFSVVVAENGRAGLDIYREYAGLIVCVLLDLTMPQMDGIETFHELRKVDDGVKVILSSGYSEEDVASRFTDGGPAGFIQKPYEPAELATLLQEVIEGAGK